MGKERIKWLDVLKLIGIVEIIFGHLGLHSTLLGAFVWAHHVPLFFFAAGCVVSHEQVKISSLVLKKARSLLLPWLLFALLSTVIYVLLNNTGAKPTLDLLLMIFKGCIRNEFVAPSLWFLTCLFVISIVFEVIKRVKNNILIILICAALFLLSEFVLPSRPIVQPTWLWNIDSAMYYMIFYAAGYISFPSIRKLLENQNNKPERYGFIISGCASLLFSGAVFFGHNPLTALDFHPVLSSLITLTTALIIIWSIIFVSYVLQDIKILSELGKHTLYICGNEFIVKTLISNALLSLGIQFSVTNTITGLLYAVFIILLVWKVFAPIEKSIIDGIVSTIKPGSNI